MIRGITTDQYRREIAWPWLVHFASRDPDGYPADQLERGILLCDRQMWCVNDWQAVVLTKVSRESVRITHCAGSKRKEWQEEVDEHFREWARELGKKRVIATVRPGWTRFGKSRGYKMIHCEMAIEV